MGHKQYFVSSDVGAGKMQWYAFHKELPGGVDAPNGMQIETYSSSFLFAIICLQIANGLEVKLVMYVRS